MSGAATGVASPGSVSRIAGEKILATESGVSAKLPERSDVYGQRYCANRIANLYPTFSESTGPTQYARPESPAFGEVPNLFAADNPEIAGHICRYLWHGLAWRDLVCATLRNHASTAAGRGSASSIRRLTLLRSARDVIHVYSTSVCYGC
jgi:hypothetical protein